MNNVTVGVYPNGDYKTNVVLPEHLDGHVSYNKDMRPGRALFVDGKCMHNGNLSIEQVAEWESKIKEMKINRNVPTIPYQ